MPKFAWNSFFYNQEIERKIRITEAKGNKKVVEIEASPTFDQKYFDDDDEDIIDVILKNESVASVLQVRQFFDKEEHSKHNIIVSPRGIFSPNLFNKDMPMIPSSFLMNNEETAQKYDLMSFEGRSEEVLRVLKILDSSIEKAETFSMNEPTLYLTRSNQKRLPISLFGDAINRATSIVLELLNQEHDVLLIDEIENGIHYSSQQEFWSALFKLANELDTMIFATTHSLEMIKAFARAGHDHPGDGAYFELARSPRDNQIVAINRDIETLDYALERGKPIRGE
jgi:AAA15 family ATPase/GTPase